MKSLLISLGLICAFFNGVGQNQKSSEELLTSHRWEIRTNTMTGVGVHKSVPKGAIIEFLKDKMWKSSESIENFKEGKWSIKNENHTLSMRFGDQEKEFLILELTTNTLRYQFRKLGAVYTFDWIKK